MRATHSSRSTGQKTERISNQEITNTLNEVASLLEAQGANPFRIKAYRNAAQVISARAEPVQVMAETEGIEGLERIPGIGDSLSHSILQLVQTGRLGILERLKGEPASETLFRSVPGIGKNLARKLHEDLGIETLADLGVGRTRRPTEQAARIRSAPRDGHHRVAGGSLSSTIGPTRPDLAPGGYRGGRCPIRGGASRHR